jgi:hypothetical protein
MKFFHRGASSFSFLSGIILTTPTDFRHLIRKSDSSVTSVVEFTSAQSVLLIFVRFTKDVALEVFQPYIFSLEGYAQISGSLVHYG